MVTMGKYSRLRLLSLGANYDRCIPIYDSTAGGRRVPLLKTLVSNFCTNDCAYCAFRRSRRVHRERFKPGELANIALKLWKRGDIRGVFLSSSVERDSDEATRRELETAEILREKEYTDYLHLRLMPSCNRYLVKRAAELADRIGLNVENPDKSSLSEIRPDVDSKIDIWRRLRWCREEADKLKDSNQVDLDTQFIVGASSETDSQILEASHKLYNDFNLTRIYYSGFRPVRRTPLEDRDPCPNFREYRLYQASFLLGDYPFDPTDFTPALGEDGFLKDLDPKLALAQSKPELFPVDLNSVSFKELLLVPRIGPKTARKIMSTRANKPFQSLSDARKRIGLNPRITIPYLSVGGERQEHLNNFTHLA